jgi:hypothetical protein
MYLGVFFPLEKLEICHSTVTVVRCVTYKTLCLIVFNMEHEEINFSYCEFFGFMSGVRTVFYSHLFL